MIKELRREGGGDDGWDIAYGCAIPMDLHSKTIYALLEIRSQKFDWKIFNVYAFSSSFVSTLNLFTALNRNVDAFGRISRYSEEKKTSNKI